jgi:hypothetical protein
VQSRERLEGLLVSQLLSHKVWLPESMPFSVGIVRSPIGVITARRCARRLGIGPHRAVTQDNCS